MLAAPRACGGTGRRARLRALWTVWSVEVRILSGASDEVPRKAGFSPFVGVGGPLGLGRRGGPIGAQFLAERALDQSYFVAGRRVVGVDEGRLEVAVTHPVLQGGHRDASRSHPSPECVAQVVKAHLPHAPGSQGALETTHQLGVVAHRSALGMAEHEILVGLVRRRPVCPGSGQARRPPHAQRGATGGVWQAAAGRRRRCRPRRGRRSHRAGLRRGRRRVARVDSRRGRRGARGAARVPLEDRRPDCQLHRPRPTAPEHPGRGSHLPGPERPRLLAESLAAEDAAGHGREDLPRARHPGRRLHPRRPHRGNHALSDYREAIAHAARNDRNGKVLFALR